MRKCGIDMKKEKPNEEEDIEKLTSLCYPICKDLKKAR